MVNFEFLTDSAYVQTGVYKVEEYFREGQHYLQRVENIVGDGQITTGTGGSANAAPATVFTYTTVESGDFSITYTLTPTPGGTDAVTADVQVNGVTVATHTIAIGGAAATYTDALTGLAIGAVVTIVATGGTTDAADVSAISFNRTKQPLPETFQREWAVFSNGYDNVLGYDPGAYGIGVGVSDRTIVVPRVKKVCLLYMKMVQSTKEGRTLVQFDGTIDDLKNAGIIGGTVGNNADIVNTIMTDTEYTTKFAAAGYNRFGNVLPQNLYYSQVDELSGFNGTFVDTAGNTLNNIQLYLQPIYMYNERPMFDYVYIQAGFRGDLDPNLTGISGHLFRWQGQFVSENIAPINRDGSALTKDGYGWYVDGTGTVVAITPTPQNITENGQTYTNADSYNVRNYTRH